MNKSKFKIWYKQLDENGNVIGEGVHNKEYAYLGMAQRVCREKYGDRTKFDAEVCWRNPWLNYSKDETCDACGNVHTVKENAWGNKYNDTIVMQSKSGVIPPSPHRSRYWSDWTVCTDCARKIHNYIESLGKST